MNLPQFPREEGCNACILHTTARSSSICLPTLRYGPSLDAVRDNPAVVVIGTSPDVDEDRKAQAFVGPTSQTLYDVYFGPSGLAQTAAIYLANAARCFTPADPVPLKALNICTPRHLPADLDIITGIHDHVFLLALGAPAARALSKLSSGKALSLDRCFHLQGKSISLFGRDYPAFYTYHSAFLYHQPNVLPAVADHLQLLCDTIRGLAPVPTAPDIVPTRPPRTT